MKNMREMIKLMEGVMAVPGLGQGDQGGAGGAEADMQTIGTGERDQAYSSFDASQTPATEEVELDEKSSSEKQARFMAACAHGADYDSCPSDKVSKEFNKADKGTEQLSKAMKHVDEAQVDTCRQTNPASARDACAMEESAMTDYDYDFIRQAISSNYDFATSEEELRKMVAGETGYGVNPEFDKVFDEVLDHFLNGDDTSFDHTGDFDDSMDGDHDSAMASAGHGSDEDYGYYGGDEFDEALGLEEARPSNINPAEINSMINLPHQAAIARAQEILAASTTGDDKKRYLANQINSTKNTMGVIKLLYDMVLKGEGNGVVGSSYSKKFDKMREAYDLQNGYNDVEVAHGDDYFPDGADGPVVDATGPSGARQGDNPEQKKMQIAEVHRELVYGYRNYLKESSSPKKKVNESVNAISDVKASEMYDSVSSDSDGISYDGAIAVEATALSVKGNPVKIRVDVDVLAVSDLGWTDEESPTGWNHRTDSPTYTSYQYASAGDIEIKSVGFSPNSEFSIDNTVLDISDISGYVHPQSLKQLLNPEIYKKILSPIFDKEAEKIDPPEPDPDDYDYDRYED